GNAFISLLTNSRGPLDCCTSTNLPLEVRADFGQKIRKDEGCSAAFGTVDRQNLIVGKIDSGIVFGDAGVVPGGDLAQVDVCDYVAGEVEFFTHSRDVVDRNHCAQDRGQSDHLNLGCSKLLVGHGDVARAEV